MTEKSTVFTTILISPGSDNASIKLLKPMNFGVLRRSQSVNPK